jgi:hypothetical protein
VCEDAEARGQPSNRKRREPITVRSEKSNVSNCLIKKVLKWLSLLQRKSYSKINETYLHWLQSVGCKNEAHDATAAGSR